jgi:hypothetical protein
MAMLQRRFASSVYAVRRSLERMRDKRQKVLDDPEAYSRSYIEARLPDDFDELPEDEQEEIMAELEAVVASFDPSALRAEIAELDRLITQARLLEKREVESKLVKLRVVLLQQGVFADPKMKLLIFTEHKDTLDYLVGKLGEEWGLAVTQIHGGMKIGDRDTANTRIWAEREFRENAQVLVATEAAGEGINLQFCWFMINYDIPWNPVRLEQRMGRIHRYGQEKDCLILNFVSTNTREGRVLQKLFERIEKIEDALDPQRTGKVFNVLGDVFPANQLEKMVRDMYARNLEEKAVLARIVEQVDVERFRRITDSTLEGLAKRELNLSALVGKSTEARERRLVPEVVEDFFRQASPIVGLGTQPVRGKDHVYRVGRVPRTLWPVGDRLEARFGKLGREYGTVVFDKALLARETTAEWVTPGHPLFEASREDLSDRVQRDLERGTVFYDLNTSEPYRLEVFAGSIKDGRGNVLERRLFVVQARAGADLIVRQPTVFLDFSPGSKPATPCPSEQLPDDACVENALIEKALGPMLRGVTDQRRRETQTIRRHIELSLNALIDRQNLRLAELVEQQQNGDTSPLLAANMKQVEGRLDELNARLEGRLSELDQEQQCVIGDIHRIGRAWVFPHPEREKPDVKPMVRDDEIERIAVEAVRQYEEARGWVVESIEDQNRGFDLISRKPHAEDPKTAMEVRFIEVKGRSALGDITLSANEYRTAERLKNDYWLYAVFNCDSRPELHPIEDPVRLGWKPIVTIDHYLVSSKDLIRKQP